VGESPTMMVSKLDPAWPRYEVMWPRKLKNKTETKISGK
jgi:hypothetical protein